MADDAVRLRGVTEDVRRVIADQSEPVTLSWLEEQTGASNADIRVAVYRLFDSKEADLVDGNLVKANVPNILKLKELRTKRYGS